MSLKVLISFTCILLSLFSSAQNELMGKWIRVDDANENPDAWKNENYDGFIIEVINSDSGIIGVALHVPQGGTIHGYSAGQIKWKKFKKVSANKFEIKGLLMIRGNSDSFDVESYITAYIKIVNSSTIKLWVEDANLDIGGKRQKWIKLPNA